MGLQLTLIEASGEKNEYETSPKYQGWTPNTNLTVTVYVEAIHYFLNINEQFNNTVKDTTTYQFSTGDDTSIGTEPTLARTSLNYALPQPRTIGATPGFELITFFIAGTVLLFIIKRRRKQTKP